MASSPRGKIREALDEWIAQERKQRSYRIGLQARIRDLEKQIAELKKAKEQGE